MFSFFGEKNEVIHSASQLLIDVLLCYGSYLFCSYFHFYFHFVRLSTNLFMLFFGLHLFSSGNVVGLGVFFSFYLWKEMLYMLVNVSFIHGKDLNLKEEKKTILSSKSPRQSPNGSTSNENYRTKLCLPYYEFLFSDNIIMKFLLFMYSNVCHMWQRNWYSLHYIIKLCIYLFCVIQMRTLSTKLIS